MLNELVLIVVPICITVFLCVAMICGTVVNYLEKKRGKE